MSPTNVARAGVSMQKTMTHSRTILLLGVLSGGALLVGCQSNRTNTYEPAVTTAEIDPVLLRKIETDPSLLKVAQVTDARERRTEGEPLVVQVSIYNSTSKPQRFLYQWEWIDANGLTLVSSSRDSWRQETIRGREVRSLQGVAPAPGITDFRLKITEPAD